MRILPNHNAAPLPPQTTTERAPRFRWPSERHLAPKRCQHCGGCLLMVSLPSSEEPLADVTCLYCARVACEVVADGWAQARQQRTEALRRDIDAPHRGRRGPIPPEGSTVKRLLAALADGRPHTLRDLEVDLDVTRSALTNAASNARRFGHQIRTEDSAYTLCETEGDR